MIDCRCAECNTCFRDHGGYVHNWRGKPVTNTDRNKDLLEKGAMLFLGVLLLAAVSVVLLGVYALADLVF